MRGVFSFFLFFCSTHCLTLGIYNGRIQGHVNRFNHVQSVFARPPAPSLSRSHTLSHTLKHSHTLPLSPSPSPSLLCLTASSYHSLSCSPIPAAVFSLSLSPSFFLSVSLCILCTLAFCILERGCRSPSFLLLQSLAPLVPLIILLSSPSLPFALSLCTLPRLHGPPSVFRLHLSCLPISV